MKALERRYPYGSIPYFGSSLAVDSTPTSHRVCRALARRLDPQGDHGVKREPFAIPIGPHVQALFKELSELRDRLKGQEVRAGDQGRPDVAAGTQSRLCGCTLHGFSRGGDLWVLTPFDRHELGPLRGRSQAGGRKAAGRILGEASHGPPWKSQSSNPLLASCRSGTCT